jgi:hypothetical protein
MVMLTPTKANARAYFDAATASPPPCTDVLLTQCSCFITLKTNPSAKRHGA